MAEINVSQFRESLLDFTNTGVFSLFLFLLLLLLYSLSSSSFFTVCFFFLFEQQPYDDDDDNKQNYFSDAWNVFDFVIVLGSFVDIIYSEMNVSEGNSPEKPKRGKKNFIFAFVLLCPTLAAAVSSFFRPSFVSHYFLFSEASSPAGQEDRHRCLT